MAEFKLELGRQRERHVEPVGRQEPVCAVGPFEQHHRLFGQVAETEFGEFRRPGHTIEVHMHQWKLRQVVALH